MQTQIVDFGMFSDEGNQSVADIVEFAKKRNLDWPGVLGMLQQLSRKEEFGESTDTAVREMVYDALGFESDFYI